MPCQRLASLCCAYACPPRATPSLRRAKHSQGFAVSCIAFARPCDADASSLLRNPKPRLGPAELCQSIACHRLAIALHSIAAQCHCGSLPSIASPQLANASPSPCAPMPCQCWSMLCPCRALIALLHLRAEAVRPACDVAHDDARDDGRREQDGARDRAPDVLHGGKLPTVPSGTLSLVAARCLPTTRGAAFPRTSAATPTR